MNISGSGFVLEKDSAEMGRRAATRKPRRLSRRFPLLQPECDPLAVRPGAC
jgi:hypothetical protein